MTLRNDRLQTSSKTHFDAANKQRARRIVPPRAELSTGSRIKRQHRRACAIAAARAGNQRDLHRRQQRRFGVVGTDGVVERELSDAHVLTRAIRVMCAAQRFDVGAFGRHKLSGFDGGGDVFAAHWRVTVLGSCSDVERKRLTDKLTDPTRVHDTAIAIALPATTAAQRRANRETVCDTAVDLATRRRATRLQHICG